MEKDDISQQQSCGSKQGKRVHLFISSNGFSFYVTQQESFQRQFPLKISFEALLFLKISFWFSLYRPWFLFLFFPPFWITYISIVLFEWKNQIIPTESLKCTGVWGGRGCHWPRICIKFLESLYWLKSVRKLCGTFESYPTIAYEYVEWSHLPWFGWEANNFYLGEMAIWHSHSIKLKSWWLVLSHTLWSHNKHSPEPSSGNNRDCMFLLGWTWHSLSSAYGNSNLTESSMMKFKIPYRQLIQHCSIHLFPVLLMSQFLQGCHIKKYQQRWLCQKDEYVS